MRTQNESGQVLLGQGDKVIERKPTREDYQKDFYETTLTELKNIRAGILDGSIKELKESDDVDWEEVHAFQRMLGSWWYCNHITGWNNNIPSSDDFNYEYDGVPDNELMSESIRDCFLAVRRGEVRWDKDFAIERLNKAIGCYEIDLDNISKLIASRPELYEEPSDDSYMEDNDDEDDEGAELEDDEDTPKPKPKQSKVEDKAQPGLGAWFQ